jgi:hypothetical protein
MRFRFVLAAFLLGSYALAQTSATKSVTVPIALDHNRILIDVDFPLADGSSQRLRAWLDNGTPELWMTHRVAALLGMEVICDDRGCYAKSKSQTNLTIVIGGMKIALPSPNEIRVPSDAPAVAPGLPAEINLPSKVLRNYDVLINYPGHELTLAHPGTLKFNGVKAKATVNAENGLVQIPSQIDKKKYNLALDLGSPVSFLVDELFDKLATTHPGWPHMTGAVGPANVEGSDDELQRKLMRIDRVQFGPLFLSDVAVAEFSKDRTATFERNAGNPAADVLGANALMNYRIGLDYAHSAVYFDIGRTFNFPDFDVIGLVLRPGNDDRFTILGVADYNGKLSVPQGPEGIQAGDHLIAVDGIPVSGSTLGQVWSLLGGLPGKARKLTVERAGRTFTTVATVQHFLGETDGGQK